MNFPFLCLELLRFRLDFGNPLARMRSQERRRMVIMPPFTIPIQVGMAFERYEEGHEERPLVKY